MSVTSFQSVRSSAQSVFLDLPLIDRNTRLTVMELRNSDKQIVNELVYRWCRIITRPSKHSLDKLPIPSDTPLEDLRKVLIIDLIGAVNPIRLATVMKRSSQRMRMIGVARGCKINSTYVTLNSYLGRQAHVSHALKLVVLYQDEFFILKTLTLLKESLQHINCHVVLVVPRLGRQEKDVLNLTSNYQILRCDFCVNRRDIGPAPPEAANESYQSYLNQIYFQRYPSIKTLPDRVGGELSEDLLHLHATKPHAKLKDDSFKSEDNVKSVKRVKSGD